MTDTRPRPPIQAQRASRSARRRGPRWVAFAIPLVLVLVGLGVFLLVRGGGDGIPIIGGGTTPVPPFDFVVRKVRAVPTSEDADAKALAKHAEAVSRELTPILDDLFTSAFLDPSAWGDGDYGAVWDRFTADARPSAEQSIETLTLGAAAGDVYDEVLPKRGTLSYEVLFDADGAPASVAVTFSFTALGARSDGAYTAIVSTGQLFFEHPEDWRITAFRVERSDRAARSPAPEPSASPTS